jgi:hypothetical protein
MKPSVPAALIIAMALGAFTAPAALAQDAKPAPATVMPFAQPSDVGSSDAILAALYDVISGPAGKQRDWNRLRSLFAPQGKLMAVANRPDGSMPLIVMTVDDYIGRNTKAFAEAGFFESELTRTTESFGPIMHVFSTYEARHAPADAKPFMRGINSIQLYNDGQRWWILNVVWRAENDKNPLPEKYLKR